MNRFWSSSSSSSWMKNHNHRHHHNHHSHPRSSNPSCGMASSTTTGVGSSSRQSSYHFKNGRITTNKNPASKTDFTMIRWFGWFLLLAIILFAWKQSLDLGSTSVVDGFFFDKFERLKRITLPSAFGGLGSFLPGLSTGIRVCINFNAQYPQGYQQNTCFLCDAYRFNAIAYQCTGQTQIPSNINFTQANCIMNNCQPMVYGNRYPPMNFGQSIGQQQLLALPPMQHQQQQQQQAVQRQQPLPQQVAFGNVQQQPQRDFA